MNKFVTLRLFVFLHFFVCLFIITLIWWSNQQQVTYTNAAGSDGMNENNVEIKPESLDQHRIHNGSDFGGGSNDNTETKKLVSDIPVILNKENDHFAESISVSLRRSGVNSRCEDYPISSSNMTIPSDKQLLIVFIFKESALYPNFANMSRCVELSSRCKFVFAPTKLTEAVAKNIFEKADFVIFHLNRPQPNTAFTDYLRSLHYPGVRNPSQRWVLFNQQAPVYSSASTDQLASLEGWFNFTISYSHVADIIIPYGECFRKQERTTNETVLLMRHLLSLKRRKLSLHSERQNETSINEYLKRNIHEKLRQEMVKTKFCTKCTISEQNSICYVDI